MDEITFKVALVADISLFVAKITFVVAEIIIREHVITSSVAKISSFMAKVTFVVAQIIFKVASVVDNSLLVAKIIFLVSENELNRDLGHLCAHIG